MMFAKGLYRGWSLVVTNNVVTTTDVIDEVMPNVIHLMCMSEPLEVVLAN